MSYTDFLEAKAVRAHPLGPSVDPASVHPMLHDWQTEIVVWAASVGRAAIWADCVAGDTVIHGPDGDRRIDALASTGAPFRVWSLTPSGDRVAATALFAFKKGRAPLYEYVLDNGRSIKVTERHRFLTPFGWTLAADVCAGSEIASVDHATLPAGAPHSKRTAGDSREHCSTGCRQCDPQPQSAVDTVRVGIPSRADARGLDGWSLHEGGQAHTPSRTRRHRGSDHPSMRDSRHLGNCASGAVGCCGAPSHPTQSVSTPRTLSLSAQSATPTLSTSGSGQCADQAAMGDRTSSRLSALLDSVGSRSYASRVELPSSSSRTRPQSDPHSIPVEPTLGSDQYAGLVETPSVTFRRVVSVHYIGVTDFYDMHVPGWENYSGNGMWHHNTGLGKTVMQVEWLRHVTADGYGLIVAPLAVCHQTIREAAKVDVHATYVRSPAQMTGPGIYVTNYEMVQRFNPDEFRAVVLDEASILKQSDGKTRTMLIQHFAGVPFRLACTATPAPNDPEELTNQAEFLGHMSRTHMLAAYFVHDDVGWRLKGHARGPMMKWMATWALAIRKPSDMGYPDAGYDLPGLNIIPHLIHVPIEAEGQLFPTDLGGVGGRAAVRRETLDARCELAAKLVIGEPDEPWLLWCGLNSEAELLADLIPGAVNVTGSWTPEDKAQALLDFADGKIRHLITKPAIASQGMNFQHCARMVFVGLSDSYEQYYQAIRRCYRYGQTRVVHAHVVLSELESQIATNIARKEREADFVTGQLVAAMRNNRSSSSSTDANTPNREESL